MVNRVVSDYNRLMIQIDAVMAKDLDAYIKSAGILKKCLDSRKRNESIAYVVGMKVLNLNIYHYLGRSMGPMGV